MAEIRRREEIFKEAEIFYLESIKILKEVKSEVVENRAKMCLSNFYLLQGNLEKSKLLLDEVLKYAEREKIAPIELKKTEIIFYSLKNEQEIVKEKNK